MTTLGGDLIRMLAHGGISTLGNVGAQYLGNYFQEKAKEKLLGLQTNLEAAGVEADPNIQQQILQQIKGPLRLATVRQEGMAPIGETPTMENLGARKGLTYPGATYAPASIERIVSPVPSLEALKSKVAMGLPGAERKTALFPKEDTLAMTLLKAQGDWALREQEGALNRQSREDIAKENIRLREAQQETTNELRKQSFDLQRERIDHQRKAFGLIAKKAGDATTLKHSADINAAWDDYTRAASAKKKDPALIAAAVEKYNNNIALAEKQVPELVGHFSPLTPEFAQTWGEWWEGKPGTGKVKGYAPAPKGATPKATIAGPVIVGTVVKDGKTYNKLSVNGKIMVDPNSGR